MIFDWTISLGNLLTVIGFTFSGLIFVLMMRGDVLVLASRVASIESAMRELAHSQLAVAGAISKIEALDERMNMISRRLDDHISSTADLRGQVR